MMKSYLFFCMFLSMGLYSQTKDVNQAADYYTAYTRERKVSDIDKAYELITQAMRDTKNQESDDALMYQSLIVRQYLEVKKPENAYDLFHLSAKSLIQAYKFSKSPKSKSQVLKLMQIAGYDLYSEGIRQHKLNKHEQSYELYSLLFQIQSLLEENKMDFTVVSSNGEKTTLPYKDMVNNMVVFCINSGKKDEAKLLFTKEVQTNPTAINYVRMIQLCYQLEAKEEAHKYIQEGLAKFPTDSDLLVYSINSSLDTKNYENALKLLDIAIAKEPTTSLYLVKSQTLESQENYEAAIDNYRNALKLYPEDFDLTYGLGYVLLNTSFGILNEQNENTKPKALARVKEAKELFMKAKSLQPTKVDYEKIFEQINNIK